MRAQTIVQKIGKSAGFELFCVLSEVPTGQDRVFRYECACRGEKRRLTIAQVSAQLFAAGISGPDALRMIDEARRAYTGEADPA